MFKNYLKIACRNLVKNKFFSVINIFGLTIGFACCLLIGIYIQNEFSYDKYHNQSSQIFRLATEMKGSTFENGIAKVGGPWAQNAKQVIPEIKEFTRFRVCGDMLFKKDNLQLYENGGFYADSSVFKMFSWVLTAGNQLTALSEPNSIVLTETLTRKLFPNGNALGQSLDINNGRLFKVTGIMKDLPPNSHFTFPFLVSLSTFSNPEIRDWKRLQYYTYLLLKPGTSVSAVENKLQKMLQANMDKETAATYRPFLQALTDIHLHSNLGREIGTNSDITTVYIFGLIAIFILFIAAMNFVNLTTARATNRAKEVGIRKVSGASKSNLIKQFLFESLLTGLISGLVAYFLTLLCEKPFEELMSRDLDFDIFKNFVPFVVLFGIIVLTCILSGVYPSVIVSAFRPVSVLKGNFIFKTKDRVRKALVVFQFTIAVASIIAVLTVVGQMNYLRKKDLGFNKDQVMIVPLQSNATVANLETVKKRLLAIPGIESVSASANQPGGSDWGIPYEAIGLPKDQHPAMRCFVVDEHFLKTYNIRLLSGRGFSTDFATDSTAYIINETAAKQLGWKDPLNHQLAMATLSRPAGPIIGIVKDFHYHSLHETIEPMFLLMKKEWANSLNIRINKAATKSVLAEIGKLWKEIDPQFPFRYNFLDEQFQSFYESEGTMSKLLFWFTCIAIVISSLGLYALSVLVAKQKTREIGIRKVLGSSVTGIVRLLSLDFIALVLIAIILASPVAWYFMNKWLNNFAYRINIQWWVFIAAGAGAMCIALATISFQAIKAAKTNPVKNLRTD